MENLGFQVNDHVIDSDGYEARIVAIDSASLVATLDYEGFSSDVPAEATEWELDELELANEDDEAGRSAEVEERYDTDAY